MFDWSNEKNILLKKERGIGFEDIVFHIERGDVLSVLRHPNADDYPNQKIMYVRVENYVYMVPFVESGETLFLKTIIPSRKATRLYLGEEE